MAPCYAPGHVHFSPVPCGASAASPRRCRPAHCRPAQRRTLQPAGLPLWRARARRGPASFSAARQGCPRRAPDSGPPARRAPRAPRARVQPSASRPQQQRRGPTCSGTATPSTARVRAPQLGGLRGTTSLPRQCGTGSGRWRVAATGATGRRSRARLPGRRSRSNPAPRWRTRAGRR